MAEGVNQKEQPMHMKMSILLLAPLVFAMTTISSAQDTKSEDNANRPLVCTSFDRKDAWDVSTLCGKMWAGYKGTAAYNRHCGIKSTTERQLKLAGDAAERFLKACGCANSCK